MRRPAGKQRDHAGRHSLHMALLLMHLGFQEAHTCELMDRHAQQFGIRRQVRIVPQHMLEHTRGVVCLGRVAHGDGDLDPAQDERGGHAGDMGEHISDGGSDPVRLSVAPVQCGGVHVAEAFHGQVSDAAVVVLDCCLARQPSYGVDVLEDVARGLRAGLVERRSAGDVGDGLAGQAWGVITGSIEMPAGAAFAVHPSDDHFHLAPAAGCVFGLVGVVCIVPDLEVGSFPENCQLVDPLDAEPLE